MSLKKHSSYNAISGINITPFTDVVLVLLIIFMIATPLLMLEGIRINLPAVSPRNLSAEKEDPFVSVLISAEGTISVDGRECSLIELKSILREVITVDPQSVIAIGPHPDTLYDTVIRVVDLARATGVEKYVLVK